MWGRDLVYQVAVDMSERYVELSVVPLSNNKEMNTIIIRFCFAILNIYNTLIDGQHWTISIYLVSMVQWTHIHWNKQHKRPWLRKNANMVSTDTIRAMYNAKVERFHDPARLCLQGQESSNSACVYEKSNEYWRIHKCTQGFDSRFSLHTPTGISREYVDTQIFYDVFWTQK